MTRIGVISALWQRHHLERAVLEHHAALRVPGVELVLCCVGSEGEASRAVADGLAIYTEHPNDPLGAKHNAAVRRLREEGVDGVVVMGSDDAANGAYFAEVARALQRGVDHLHLRGLWMHDLATDRTAYMHHFFTGAGVVVSKALLDFVGWQPWTPDRQRRLDGDLHNRVKPHARKLAWISDLRRTDIRLVDIKSETNMWGYDDAAAMCDAQRERGPWLHKHFPALAGALTTQPEQTDG